MAQNQGGRPSPIRPICPQPLYFNRSSTIITPDKTETLFQAYCQHINATSTIPLFQAMSPLLQQTIYSNFNRKQLLVQERASGITQENGKSLEELSSQKGEYMIDGQDQIIQQKISYSKFLKRSTANDTKNIPKNFGKAIISFIQKNQKVVLRCVKRYGISLQPFIRELKAKKKILHSIRQLRSLWMQEDFIYAKPFRQLSYYFLRRAGHRYIFGSRVSDFANHLKYRDRIMNALKCPRTFSSIKA